MRGDKAHRLATRPHTPAPPRPRGRPDTHHHGCSQRSAPAGPPGAQRRGGAAARGGGAGRGARRREAPLARERRAWGARLTRPSPAHARSAAVEGGGGARQKREWVCACVRNSNAWHAEKPPKMRVTGGTLPPALTFVQNRSFWCLSCSSARHPGESRASQHQHVTTCMVTSVCVRLCNYTVLEIR